MTTHYDELAYPERPFRQTHPDRLATMGMMLGMTPADPATARILDIGCGSALNITAMAATMPQATFLGFDLAKSAVDQARARIDRLGLRNIRVEHLDLLAFPADAGEFDYIIAHGFYSWVPAAVREGMLALMRRHASANGLCFVSFNARPGSTLRLAWRDAAAYHTRAIADTVARAKASVDMLEMMAEAAAALPGAWKDCVSDWRDMAREKGIAWMGHDDFGPIFEPFHFHEVATAIARHGLQYVSDACYFDSQPYELGDGARRILQSLEQKDILLREQYFDFLEMKSFRQILLCRSEVGLRRPVDCERLRGMEFSSPAVEEEVAADGRVIAVNPLTGARSKLRPISRSILAQLRHTWPCSVPFAEVLPGESDRAVVAQTLERLWACALAEAHALPQRCGRGTDDRPVVGPLGRLQAVACEGVTTRVLSQCLPDETTRELIPLLDGSRSRAELADIVPDLDRRLEWLARMGLLEPECAAAG